MTKQFNNQPPIYQPTICAQSIVLRVPYAIADDPSPKRPRNTSRLGELAEAHFVVKAETLNFAVARPWSASQRYDFIVDSGKRLSRVQLKCTDSINDGAYQITPKCRLAANLTRPYTAEDIDYLVGYVVPRDIWYIIPIAAMEGISSLRFHPDSTRRRPPMWEVYREAWHLLRDPA